MSAAEKPRLTAGGGKARRWRSFPPGGARFPCAFGAAGETCKECLRLGAQTPRPPGGAGRYDFTWRAAALQTSDGWCGREARRSERGGGTCRVSCARWALETLAPPPFAAKTAHATASVGWVWDPPVSERRPRKYRAQHGPRPQGAGHAKQHNTAHSAGGRSQRPHVRSNFFPQKRLTRRKDGAIIPPINAEGGRAGMKAARMDHSSAYSFTFGFTFMRKALLRCAV